MKLRQTAYGSLMLSRTLTVGPSRVRIDDLRESQSRRLRRGSGGVGYPWEPERQKQSFFPVGTSLSKRP
jgi:hypothetical protein